jgi:hypothetical protein
MQKYILPGFITYNKFKYFYFTLSYHLPLKASPLSLYTSLKRAFESRKAAFISLWSPGRGRGRRRGRAFHSLTALAKEFFSRHGFRRLVNE